MVSPVDSLNSGGDRNHDISSPFPFHHFCKFTSLNENLLGCMTNYFFYTHSPLKLLFPANYSSPVKRRDEIPRLHHSSFVGPALPAKQLIGAGRPLQLSDRELPYLKYLFLQNLSCSHCIKIILSCAFDYDHTFYHVHADNR
jgi:hypothetical protein